MAKIDRDELLNFWHTFINANIATLVITGDMTAKQAKSLANHLTAKLPTGKSYKHTLDLTTPVKAGHIHILHNSSQ
ncbi:insulinase family protein, partial [Moraxella catarrhalis]|uniref:insulinase family protein n=1 Tax=Moraxella catarrhalis TaxID=480 RepID=UPI0029E7DB10